MPRVTNPLELLFPDLFFELAGFLATGQLFLKLEGFNVTGSIKVKPALFMIDDLERQGRIDPGRTTIVESSSGNLGVALALICRLRGYKFLCVSDPNITSLNLRAIEAYGGRIVIIRERDANGGYLEARLAYIRRLVAELPNCVWVNQYANDANVRAHSEWTALEVLNEFDRVTHVYAGTGTTGTVMGLAERFAKLSPRTQVIAVEPDASVTFDPTRTGRRLIPGIGTSRKPEIADARRLHRIAYVSEIDAIKMCHLLVRRHGLLVGGSTGSVLAAVARDAAHFDRDSVIVAISPDLGDKYLDTIYSPEWVRASYGIELAALDDSDIARAAHAPNGSTSAEASGPGRRGRAKRLKTPFKASS